MTDQQTTIAVKILQYLASNNNYELDGNIHTYVSNGDTSDMGILDDYLYVKNTLENDYRLIRADKNIIMLTPDGEAAQRIGFEKYLKSVKNGKQLELTLKRMDLLDKWLSILKESRTILIIVVGLVTALCNWVAPYIVPLIKGAFAWLTETIATLTASL